MCGSTDKSVRLTFRVIKIAIWRLKSISSQKLLNAERGMKGWCCPEDFISYNTVFF